MIFPTKFVSWEEVNEWSWLLAQKIENSRWRPDVIVAVGRGCFVVSRLLCDLLRVERLLVIPVRWHERNQRRGENYLASLIRVFVKASEKGLTPEKGIAKVVRELEVRVEWKPKVSLRGQKALLLEEIVATGMHFKIAKDIVKQEWNANETKTATLVWKESATITPDYYILRPKEFVWFQFPWSRLSDYIQFLNVMLSIESKSRGKSVWSEEEISEVFRVWYGANPDPKYLRGALNILERISNNIKLLGKSKVSVLHQ